MHKEHKTKDFIKNTAADFAMSVKTRTVQNDFGNERKHIIRKKKLKDELLYRVSAQWDKFGQIKTEQGYKTGMQPHTKSAVSPLSKYKSSPESQHSLVPQSCTAPALQREMRMSPKDVTKGWEGCTSREWHPEVMGARTQPLLLTQGLGEGDTWSTSHVPLGRGGRTGSWGIQEHISQTWHWWMI